MFGFKLIGATVLGWMAGVGATGLLGMTGLPDAVIHAAAWTAAIAVVLAAISPALDLADEEFE